jgi:hypothetical protein
MPYGLAAMLKEGHKHFSGLDEAVYKNIEACKQLSQITKSSMGPNGVLQAHKPLCWLVRAATLACIQLVSQAMLDHDCGSRVQPQVLKLLCALWTAALRQPSLYAALCGRERGKGEHAHARPAGMNKMVINHLEKLFVTSDASTIINELEVEHPAARLLVLAAKAQEAEIGDGTNFVRPSWAAASRACLGSSLRACWLAHNLPTWPALTCGCIRCAGAASFYGICPRSCECAARQWANGNQCDPLLVAGLPADRLTTITVHTGRPRSRFAPVVGICGR